MREGTIFNIQKFCVNDGPGIRTTVFMKGCPLSCVWCHNPESKLVKQEIFYDKRKCILCGACTAICPENCHTIKDGVHIYDRNKCITCGKCAEMCIPESLEAVGKISDIDTILSEVMKDEVFYDNSGGGLTVSGGEPMLQFEFTYELLKSAKEKGLHVCMETCGFSKEENYQKIAEFVDIFLFDYKITDSDEHKKYTGVDNSLILKNLRNLNSIGKEIILRCPIIPGINDNENHFSGIADIANELENVTEINIEPYHPLGKGKSDMLDKDYVLGDLSFPENETVENWIEIIKSKTSKTVKKA